MKWERGILWFRHDLRLHDHQALRQALEHVREVIPVYVFDPRQWEKSQYGPAKTGRFRTTFLLESLHDLQQQLIARGSNLMILHGKPEEVLVDLAHKLKAGGVFLHREVGTEEQAVENALETQLFKEGIGMEVFWGQTLYHLHDLPMPLHALPDVFTQFRKQVEQDTHIRPPFPTPVEIPSPAGLPKGAIPDLSFFALENVAADPRGVLDFQGGESAGKARVEQWVWEANHLQAYKETRNGLVGESYSSKFSPWLSLGCLSPRFLYQTVRSYEQQRVKNSSTYWLIFELIWRDYFHFVAQRYADRLFQRQGLKSKIPTDWPQIPSDQQEHNFQRWQAGETGLPFIDANMRELAATGFMSNRGRQNVASFLVKDLGVDWRLGAAWFESQLIDYSVASNWGNWAYVAGVGNDPREHRYFNTLSQAQRYDVRGDYVRHWIPTLASLPAQYIHEPWRMRPETQTQLGVSLGQDYPYPILKLPGSMYKPNALQR